MHLRRAPHARSAFLTMLLAAIAPGQTKDDVDAAKVDAPESSSGGAAEKKAEPVPPRIVRTPEQLRADEEAKAKLPGVAAGYVMFDAGCQPRAVAAGQRGTMVGVMSLRKNAVMLSPPQVQFTFETAQGPLQLLGKPAFRPPSQSGLAPGLKGLEAYDDYAIFDLPFAVAPEAQPGSYPLEIAMRYTLLDGTNGTAIGSYTDPIRLDVRVLVPGASFDGDTVLGAATAGSHRDGPTVGEAPTAAAATTSDESLRGRTVDRAEPATPAEATGGSLPPTPAQSSNWVPWSLAGVAALVLGLLVLRRR